MTTPSLARRTLVGRIILTSGALLFLLVAFQLPSKLFGGGGRVVRATFETTQDLHLGEPVRIHGVAAGKVSRIEFDRESGHTEVEMRLDDDAAPLYANARAAIKWRTLLGATYAVAIDPGTPGLPPLPGNRIPVGRTSAQVELDEVAGALTDRPRKGLRRVLSELPRALDAENPGAFLSQVEQHSPTIAAATDALRGRHPGRDLAVLIDRTGTAMRALGTSQQRLRGLVAGAAATTEVTAARSSDIESLLRIGDAALPRVRGHLARLQRTLDSATPLLRRLARGSGELRPTVVALTPAVRKTDALLRGPGVVLLRSLRPTARKLASLARDGAPLLDELSPSLERIDKHVLPDLAKRSPESRRRTYEMIGPAIAGLAGIAGHYDGVSSFIRFTGNAGARIVDDLPCRAWFADPGSSHFLQCQALGDVLRRVIDPPTRKKR